MKYVLVLPLVLISMSSFSQDKKEALNQLPLLTITGQNGNFENVYNKLNTLSKNISETTVVYKRQDEIRQGQLVISTDNWGKRINTINLDTRPSLAIEAERVMFTGNFLNPNNPSCLGVD